MASGRVRFLAWGRIHLPLACVPGWSLEERQGDDAACSRFSVAAPLYCSEEGRVVRVAVAFFTYLEGKGFPRRSASGWGMLQRKKGDVIFLLPPFSGETVKLL
jgi:hypothetical protein